jgi:hypothetical protein
MPIVFEVGGGPSVAATAWRKSSRDMAGTRKPVAAWADASGAHHIQAGRGLRLVVGVRPATAEAAETSPPRVDAAPAPAAPLQGARVREALRSGPTARPARRTKRAGRASALSRQACRPPWGPPSASASKARGASPQGHPSGPSNSGSQGGAATSWPARMR